MYKSIIFDIGGVLVDFDPKAYLVDRLCNAEMEEKVYDLTFGSEEWQLLDAGKLSRYDGNQRMLEHARAEGCAFEVQGVLDDWMHILRPRLRMLELVRRLKSHGYCVYYLSNIPQDVLELLTERGVLAQFDGGVASCEVQVNKPDPQIYKALLKKYQLKASECVFIDDRLENVQAAFALGFAGIQMKDSVGTLIRSLLCVGRNLLFFVALAVVRGLHLLGGAAALLRHLDLRQITFAAVHIVAARADITGHADVFHAYHLFVHRLPCGARVYTWILSVCLFGFPLGFERDRHVPDRQHRMHRQHTRASPAHDCTNFLPHFRFIAMDLAGGTEGLCFHKRALFNARKRIIVQLPALRA